MYFDYRVNDEYGILNSGNFERAEEYYSEYIANNETWANENRGDLFYFKGEYQKALLDYQIAGLSGIPYAKQIMTLTKLDQMDQAIDLAEKYNQDMLIGLNVKVHELVKALALAQNALSNKVDELKFELSEGRYVGNSDNFAAMVRTRVNSGEYLQHSYYIRIANIHARIRNYAEAEKYFALAIKVESDYEAVYGKLASESYSALADYYMYIGDLDNAIKNYSIAFENSGRSEYKDGLISAYLLKGDLQMATIELDSAFKMHPLGYDPELFDLKKILLEKQQKISAANAVDKEKEKNKIHDLSTDVKLRVKRDIEDLKNEHKLVLDYSDFVRAVSIHE
jgi:tetratricopeptide (TPR) repeat protein